MDINGMVRHLPLQLDDYTSATSSTQFADSSIHLIFSNENNKEHLLVKFNQKAEPIVQVKLDHEQIESKLQKSVSGYIIYQKDNQIGEEIYDE